jgi:hypothetical protein
MRNLDRRKAVPSGFDGLMCAGNRRVRVTDGDGEYVNHGHPCVSECSHCTVETDISGALFHVFKKRRTEVPVASRRTDVTRERASFFRVELTWFRIGPAKVGSRGCQTEGVEIDDILKRKVSMSCGTTDVITGRTEALNRALDERTHVHYMLPDYECQAHYLRQAGSMFMKKSFYDTTGMYELLRVCFVQGEYPVIWVHHGNILQEHT